MTGKIILLLSIITSVLFAKEENLIPDQVFEMSHKLASYPRLEYPNSSFSELFRHFENGKVLIFGYDTLAYPHSALQSLSEKTVASMKPALAFGLFRLLQPFVRILRRQHFSATKLLSNNTIIFAAKY